MEDFARAFSDIDVVVGPTLPLTAWRIGERSVRIGDADRKRSGSLLAPDLPVESYRRSGTLHSLWHRLARASNRFAIRGAAVQRSRSFSTRLRV